MARSYSNPSLVSLPTLSAPNAVTLTTQVISVAEIYRSQLSPTLIKAVDRLADSVETLSTSRILLDEVAPVDPNAALTADGRVDAACGGFHGFLQGWARLPSPGPGAEKAVVAQQLLDRLYPRGLGFTQLPFMTQWAEVKRLLGRARLPENAELIAKVGGETFVEAIGASFEAYGEALQVTKRRTEAKASVRGPLDAVVGALRSYVLRVQTHADAGDDMGDAGARDLAEALLAPLVAWQSSGGRKKAAEGPGDEPTPAPGGGPAPVPGEGESGE
jgi:hypothetical protein